MKLSTGRMAIPIEFDNGDIETIYINTHDKGLIARLNNFENSIKARFEKIDFSKYQDKFADGGIDASMLDFDKLLNLSAEEMEKLTEKTTAIAELNEEFEKQVKEEMDAIFDGDVSSKLFKYVPPLAEVETEDGAELYILQAIKAIANEVQKRGKALSESAQKHLKKYGK